MKKALLLLLVLAVLLGAAVGGGLIWLEDRLATPVAPGDTATVEFAVPKGATARALGPLLADAGLIEEPWLWRIFLWQRGKLDAKAGRHALSRGMTLDQLATALEGTPLPEDQPFAIVEGWRLRDIDAALAAKSWIQPGDYVKAASEPSRFQAPFALPKGPGRTLEGYLYPETYRVVPGSLDLHALIQRQLDLFVERVYSPHRAEVEAGKRTLDQLVIMASLLEREEPVPEQRPLVAGILWKRLDRGFPLGVDATSRYQLPEWNDRQAFLARLRDERDPWNTRVKKGLPPGPIGAATAASFQAALAPAKSDYLYYLHDGERRLHPARDGAEHEANRKRFGVW
jgi:UPF0755 protein